MIRYGNSLWGEWDEFEKAESGRVVLRVLPKQKRCFGSAGSQVRCKSFDRKRQGWRPFPQPTLAFP